MIYLYVKEHAVTGLKYFGKTAKRDPYVYAGSGKYWKKHIQKHGKFIKTLSVWSFEDIDECERFALQFSKDNNIVESKEWANLREENGKDGTTIGSPGMKGHKNPRYGKVKNENPFYGKKHSEETLLLYRKQKAGGNNPRARKVTTPHGQFDTVKEAGKTLHMSLVRLRRLLNEGINGYHWGW